MEKWKSITGFNGIYEVSNHGNIKTLDRFVNSGLKHSTKVLRKSKILKPSINKYGYLQLSLTKNGKKFNKTVHQLVAIEFIENINNYTDVNHKDTNKLNNFKTNLEWCTPAMNNAHAVKHRLFPHGENSHKTTLKLIQVIEIRNKYNDGLSSYKLANIYKVTRTTINNIVNRKTWKYD